jgi:predicted DCC family thiol-disulfide oxidoreductase YuxK
MISSDRILLFDGVCNLCNRLVFFIIRRDVNAQLKFTALQSPLGEAILIKNGLASGEINSIVFLNGSRYFLKSSAVLNLFKVLGGRWSMIYGLIIIPKFIRDYFYDIIAKSRYRIFGKTDACMIPPSDCKDRFLK